MGRPRLYDMGLRERLLERAMAMAAAGGVDGVSLRLLARDVGTSTNAIYTMFGSKEALLALVFRSAVESFAQAQFAFGTTDDALQDLYSLGRNYRRWALANEPLYLVMLRRDEGKEQGADGTDELAGQTMMPLRSVVQRLVDEGIFIPFDPDQIAMSIWMSVHGFVSLEIAQHPPREKMDVLYQIHLDSIMRGWILPAQGEDGNRSGCLPQEDGAGLG